MFTRIAALAIAAVLTAPNLAYPCGNAVYLEKDEATRLVAKVERAFRRGEYRKVRRLGEEMAYELEGKHLQRKLLKLVAVAQLRTGDAADGTAILEALLSGDPSDTYLQTRLGEGLARSGHRERALETLEKLEAADLIADPEGWLTLAQLRDDGGDHAGRDRALERCKQQTKKRSRCILKRPKSRKAVEPTS